jgi:hypothetical protein
MPARISRIISLATLAQGNEDALRQLRTAFASDAEIQRTVKRVLHDYWRRFESLCDKAQASWALGFWLYHLSPGLREQSRSPALMQFLLAVELEIRDRVFSRFRNHVREDPRWLALAKEASGSSETETLARYIETGRPLTLGQMHYTLGVLNRKNRLVERFRDWLRQNQDDLAVLPNEPLNKLGSLTDIRNELAHENSVTSHEGVPEQCRAVLEKIRS